MAGILSYGAYIPFNRLQRAAIGAALETKADKGERAIASFDEDTVTMVVEASRAALAGAAGALPASLFFATTEPPYQEKLNAATIHAALDLPAQTRAHGVGDLEGRARVSVDEPAEVFFGERREPDVATGLKRRDRRRGRHDVGFADQAPAARDVERARAAVAIDA